MLDIFRGLKNLIKVSHVHIDSTIFRLHYTFTVMCLLAFSLIVTTRQYVGNPIDCVHTKDIPEDVLNTYCWIHSTYTIPSAFWKRIGIDVAHPGIDKTIDPEERRYVKYYQWVCFCLFFQVSLIPRGGGGEMALPQHPPSLPPQHVNNPLLLSLLSIISLTVNLITVLWKRR